MTEHSAIPATLAGVLAKAVGGDTVRLEPGAYGDVTFSRQKFSAPLTVASANSSAPARLRSLNISECANLTVEGLDVRMVPDAKTQAHTAVVRVYKSSDVVLRGFMVRCGAAVTGVALASDPNLSRAAVGDNVLGLPTGRGVSIDQSQRILVEDCDLANLHKGVVANKSADVIIRGNDIGEVRTSPIVGTGVARLNIEGNRLHTARPWNFGGKGDHGDFIHLWTTLADAKPAGPVRIVGNLIDQAGGDPILGIFIEDAHGIGWDVDIADNTILNGNPQGIAPGNAKGKVTGNTLLQTSGDPKKAPSLLLRGDNALEVRGNTFHDIYGWASKAVGPSLYADNKILPPVVQSAKVLDAARSTWAAKYRGKPVPAPEPIPEPTAPPPVREITLKPGERVLIIGG